MLNQMFQGEPFFTFLLVIAFIGVIAVAGYGVLRFSEWRSDRYWRRVLAEGARLAREHPEWLAEAVAEHDIAPSDTREIAVVAGRAEKVLTVETAPRKELERYAHRLEGMVIGLRDQLLAKDDLASELQHKLEWALDWKGKHWRRIQRVDEALRNDEDVFAALHPRLAREQAG